MALGKYCGTNALQVIMYGKMTENVNQNQLSWNENVAWNENVCKMVSFFKFKQVK